MANEITEKLSLIQRELEKLSKEANAMTNEHLVYYDAIKKVIDCTINHEEIRERFDEINGQLFSMANFDFSKRLKIENAKDLFSCFGLTLNMVNEELDGLVIHRHYMDKVLDILIEERPDLLLITNNEGNIINFHKAKDSFVNIKKESILNHEVSLLFKHYSLEFEENKNAKIFKSKVQLNQDLGNLFCHLTSVEIKYHVRSHEILSEGYIYCFKEIKKGDD